MPYLVNLTNDSLRIPELRISVEAGARAEGLTEAEAARAATNVNFAVFNDPAEGETDGTPFVAPEPEPTSPSEPTQSPSEAPEPDKGTVTPETTTETVQVPAGEHVEIVPNQTNGA